MEKYPLLCDNSHGCIGCQFYEHKSLNYLKTYLGTGLLWLLSLFSCNKQQPKTKDTVANLLGIQDIHVNY